MSLSKINIKAMSWMPPSAGIFGDFCTFFGCKYPDGLMRRGWAREYFVKYNEKYSKSDAQFVINQAIYDRLSEEEFKILQLLFIDTTYDYLDGLITFGRKHKCVSLCSNVITISERHYDHSFYLKFLFIRQSLVLPEDSDEAAFGRVHLFHSFLNNLKRM
jgi:hypothetical protein